MNLTHGGDWAGFETEYGTRPLDFSANVSPLGLPDGVRSAAIRALDDADRYPDPLCRRLCAALAAHHGVPAETIVCGNGAADLIWRLCRMLKPKKAALFVPTFTEYARALWAGGCEIIQILLPEARDFRLSAHSVARIPQDCGLIFLCNPNNPTGRLADRAALRALLALCRERDMTLVADECFLDFCEEPGAHSLLGALADNPKLVILRAFTKTCAMAGLRLGYALCGSAAPAEKLRGCGQPWAVSSVAQAAGIAALQEEAYVNQLRTLITAERRRMSAALSSCGLRVIPGEANYLLWRAEDAHLGERLRERGILIRGCGDFAGLSANWYRTAIRTKAENDQLLKALREAGYG